MKEHICKIFGLNSNITEIDTLILQCAEDFTKCIFYCDCNLFDIETNMFMKYIESI